ncbi:XVIPCD domain-containing protein [Lysobacter sp. Root667]|uniref:XVIPCD domain-containing protein n=1 Tax=Lysobacter sp. Root667 TaxID=1736581 RepID=UPI000B0DA75E|nr:XVIPCD domain-containing protein [Lysobacter sp. Root667]
MTDTPQHRPAARPGLTNAELRATIYFAMGVSSESGEKAYGLAVAGDLADTARIETADRSGYTIGTIQTDLGQHYQPNVPGGENVPADLVNAYQAWARTHHSDWVLNQAQVNQTTADLGRKGTAIRDEQGRDIDATVRSHLDSFLASDAGVTWVHDRDVAQVDKLMDRAIAPLQRSQVYRDASGDDQVKLVAMVAKVYNQNEAKARPILAALERGQYHSVNDVSDAIGNLSPAATDYFQTGRDKALHGADVVNALRNSHPDSPLHPVWEHVTANPLINPTRLDQDRAHPNLPGEYATVRRLFVNYEQAEPFIHALDRGGAYQQARTSQTEPGRFNDNGVYAAGNDFVTWDRKGNGHAFVRGTWSEVDRDDLSRVNQANRVVDLNIDRNGASERLLRVDRNAPALRAEPAPVTAQPAPVAAPPIANPAGPAQPAPHRPTPAELDRRGNEIGPIPAPGAPRPAGQPLGANDARDRNHPDHAAFGNIRGVLAADGRWNAEQCDNISAQLLCRHKADPLSHGIDRVAIGRPTANGEVHVFAMYSPSGERGPHFHAQVEANQAARIPAAQSFDQLAQISAQQTQQQAQGLSGPESPGRGAQRMG